MATLLDVWNAGTRLESQRLDMLSAQRKEEADTDLQKRQLGILRESQQFLDELDMDGEPEKYLEKWDSFNKELRTVQERNLSGVQQSPYYRQRLDELFSQNEVRFESAVRGKQIQRVRQTIRANELDSLNEIETLYKNDPQSMIDASNEILQQGIDNNTIAPEEYIKMKNYYWDKATAGVIDTAVMDAFTKGKTYNDIDSIIDGIDLSGLTDTRTTLRQKEDGTFERHENDPQWLAPKREAAKKAGKERAKQTWNTYITGKQKENENTVSKTYGQILTGVTQGVASRDDILRGIAEVYSFGDPFFDPDERDTYVRWYNDLLKGLEKSPDEAKRTAWRNILDTNMAAYIQAGIRGASGDEKGMRTMYDAYDKWLGESLEKLQEKGYRGNAADMRLEFAETIGTFFDEAEKALPAQLKGTLKDAENFVGGLYGTQAKPVSSTLSEKYPGMKETIAGAVMEELRDWLFGNDLSQMTLEKASAQINAIVNAQVANELDVLRKDPATGKLGYERQGGESEEALLARTVKALENREVVWTDENGNVRYALGTEEGVTEAQSRLREQLAERLKAHGIAPGEINMELTESAAERDKDATPIFSARGTQYRFQSDGKTLSLQSRAAGSDTWGKPVPVTAPKTNTTASAIAHPDGSEKQEQEAIRKEIQGIIRINKKQRVIFPGASDASTWPHMLDRGAAYQYLENLRKTKPEVYEDYKRRLEATEGQ